MDIKIKQQYKGLNLIYLIILGSMSAAAILAVYFVFKAGALSIYEFDEQNIIKSVIIIALLVGIPVGHIFYQKKMKHINVDLNLGKKINMFKTAFIIRIAMLEGIGLLTLIGYLITGDKSFLYMFAVVFILFIIHAPTRQRIISDLELSDEEQEQLS